MTEFQNARCVEEILIKVKELIPNSETKLLEELNNFQFSLRNKAPEVKKGSYCWIPFINILNFYIPNIVEKWQIEIRNIINIDE